MASSPAESLQPLPPGAERPPGMPEFDRSRSGYHPTQVHRYVSGLLAHIDGLERTIAHDAGKLVHGFAHDANTPQGRQLLGDLMKMATDEITGQQAAAAEEVAQMFRNAEEDISGKHAAAAAQAKQLLDGAQQEANGLVSGAREQADTVLQTAHGQAKEMVDRASARAAAVHEGAQRRLQALAELHAETRRRLTEIHEVTGGVLGKDEERGSLQDEVARITGEPMVAEVGAAPLPPADQQPAIAEAVESPEHPAQDEGHDPALD